MAEFIYSQPVKIYFGEGEFERISEILSEAEIKRCVLVCGKHFADKAAKIQSELPEICAVFSEVEPNPQLSGVTETVRLAREHNADAVMGIGGGSSLDTAKFAAAVALGEDSAERCYKTASFAEKRLKIIAVPTTAGTGSEVTQVSVISRGSEKKTINHPSFMPSVAIVDPALTVSVPPRTTMNTGLDALAHALEGFWSRNHQPICDLYAEKAVALILQNLEAAYRDGGNMSARRNMSMASLLAGLAFAQPKTAACHACSYPLSADYHLPHGEACAFTLDSFVRINADDRLDGLCKRVGLADTAALAENIAEFKALAGLKTKLSELHEVDIEKLAKDCAEHPLMQNNPVCMDKAALIKMFEGLK